jgi:hypothetical protein
MYSTVKTKKVLEYAFFDETMSAESAGRITNSPPRLKPDITQTT